MHHLKNSKCKRRLAQNLYLNSKGSQISSPLKLEEGAEISLSIFEVTAMLRQSSHHMG
jgi:hypothetical protein